MVSVILHQHEDARIACSTRLPAIHDMLDRGLPCITLAYRACPKGIDPYPEIDGVYEEQLIDCYCPDQCSGSLQLSFRGHSTRPVPFDSSAELVKYRLEVIHSSCCCFSEK